MMTFETISVSNPAECDHSGQIYIYYFIDQKIIIVQTWGKKISVMLPLSRLE